MPCPAPAPAERRAVPCCGCTTCCRSEMIILHPEDGDRPADYQTRRAVHPLTGRSVHVLRQKPDGACVYLGKQGCTIHDRAPAICRGFDCRRFFDKFRAGVAPLHLLGAMRENPVLQAGARLMAEQAR